LFEGWFDKLFGKKKEPKKKGKHAKPNNGIACADPAKATDEKLKEVTDTKLEASKPADPT
jgi:hypothetical protein